jgi:hypothetical protein
MPPSTRLRLADEMSSVVRELSRAGERARAPEEPARWAPELRVERESAAIRDESIR